MEKGYEDQIVISHDYCVFLDWFPQEQLSKMRLDSDNKWSFSFIPMDIIPKLIDKGVTEKQIRTLTIENPLKILS